MQIRKQPKSPILWSVICGWRICFLHHQIQFLVGCVDVPGIYLVCYEMHIISNAISSSPNPKKGISKLCWLEMACPQFEELVSGISNAGCEFRMAYLIVLRISRKAHKIYKMYISLDKICISNSEMLSPDDNACDLVVEFFGGFKSVFEGSFFHISNCVLHLFLHLYIGYIMLENRFGKLKTTFTNRKMGLSDVRTLHKFGMAFGAGIFEFESAMCE
jgi:hypothetical protein